MPKRTIRVLRLLVGLALLGATLLPSVASAGIMVSDRSAASPGLLVSD